jgi:hypothetical protein
LNTSQTPVVINLPPNVFNLYQSYLDYLVNLAAPGANYYLWNYEDTLCEISHIQLYESNNQWLCDLDNLQNYLKYTIKRDTSIQEYLTFDPLNSFQVSNSLVNQVPALRHGVANTGLAPTNPSNLNYIEPAYFSVQAINAPLSYQVQFPLRFIKNSIFAIDKNLYAGQLMYLRSFFGPITKIAYATQSNANPSSGFPSPPGNTSQTYAGVATISNLQLMLAIETNEANRAKAIAETNSPQGMSMIIPYPQSYKNSNSGTSQNISIQVDAGNGRSLMKVIHQVYNNNEMNDTAYDCTNVPNAVTPQKVLQYWTQINGQRLQDLSLTCTGNSGDLYTDYMQQKNAIRGSVLESYNVFAYTWAHVDDFCNFGPKYDQNNSRCDLIAGKPLDALPVTWTFVGNQMVSGTYQHYTWMIFTKKLTMSPQGITVQ